MSPALAALVQELIPTDDLPGAAEAGTAEAVLAHADELVLRGVAALDRMGFAQLASAQRRQVLEQLANGAPPPGWAADDPPPAQFWPAVRALALAQFYGSEQGRRVTGFPGPSVDRGGYRHNIVEG